MVAPLSQLSLFQPATPGGLPFGGTPVLGSSAQSTYCQPSDVVDMFPFIGTSVDPTALASAVTNATWYIENYTQRRFFPTQYDEETMLIVAKRRRIVGRVRNYPIISVDTLQWRTIDDNTWTLGDPTQIDIKKSPSRLFYYRGPVNVYTGADGDLSYTYTAGYQQIPGDIVTAAKLLSLAFVMRNANPMGALSISSTVEGAANSLGLAAKSTHQADAEDIMTKWIRWE